MRDSPDNEVRGVLAAVTRLDSWLHWVLVVLVVVSAIRYETRHALDAFALLILAGGACLIAISFLRKRLPPVPWVLVAVCIWAVLTIVAPSFAWTAVPIAFAVLRVLPFRVAAVVVAAMTLTVSAAWLRITDGLDPTVIVGPIAIAVVTVLAFRALEREAAARQQLLDDLTAAQADLADAQRHFGALSERTRLSRDIHDSVGQGLSSINLLLHAAEQDWTERPAVAREHVRVAAATARDGLDEVRRVVRDLAPAELDGETAQALPIALRRVIERSTAGAAGGAHPGGALATELRVHGTPVPVAPELANALVHTTRGALANVIEHAGARRAVVSLTYADDEVLLDIRDDGAGFAPGAGTEPNARRRAGRGTGLAGIRDRAATLGGRVSVESAPGEGTAISVALPIGAP